MTTTMLTRGNLSAPHYDSYLEPPDDSGPDWEAPQGCVACSGRRDKYEPTTIYDNEFAVHATCEDCGLDVFYDGTLDDLIIRACEFNEYLLECPKCGDAVRLATQGEFECASFECDFRGPLQQVPQTRTELEGLLNASLDWQRASEDGDTTYTRKLTPSTEVKVRLSNNPLINHAVEVRRLAGSGPVSALAWTVNHLLLDYEKPLLARGEVA